MKDSNIGETGIGSIRLNGQRIEDLPLAEGARAKEQLPMSIETERLNKINEVNAKYPPHRIDYLVGRIKECQGNILNVTRLSSEQVSMISEYEGLISMCEYRDKEILRVTNEEPPKTAEQSIKRLQKDFPPYNVTAMRQQIKQCREAIDRCADVVKQENDSIAELSEVLALCKKRDFELAQYGAKAEGS